MKGKLFIGCIFFIFVSLVFSDQVKADEILLNNGDRITGKIMTMEEGKLTVETSYAGKIIVQWSAVANLKTDEALKVVLSDKTSLQGITEDSEEGKMKLKLGKIVETVSFDLGEVASLNPELKPAVKLKGHVNVGLNATSGNSNTESQHADGEFAARTEQNRYTFGAELNRVEDDGEKTVDNSMGYLKYDHFLSPQWFLYSNALFEKDTFKDLNMRTGIGIGAGRQFIESPLMNLFLESGLTYINEDFDQGDDDSYSSGRWSLSFDKYFLDKIVQFFHFHEGLVGLEDTDKLIIRTRTGLRLPFYNSFNFTAQYNYDWEKTPSPGREKSDKMYIFTLGYQWD